MRFVVTALLLALFSIPALAQDAPESKKDIAEQAAPDELGTPRQPRTLEKPRKAAGYYESEEFSELLSPFGPAGLVYLTLIVFLMGGVVHILAQSRKQAYLEALARHRAELEERREAARAVKAAAVAKEQTVQS